MFYWRYFRNGWSDRREMTMKCMDWVLGQLCDLNLWHHPDFDLGISRENFWIAQEWEVWLMGNGKKVYWLDAQPSMWPGHLTWCSIFQMEFVNSCLLRLGGLIDWKCIDWMLGQIYDPNFLLHLDFGFSRLNVWISQEWKGYLTRNKNDWSQPILTMAVTFDWPLSWTEWMHQIVTGVNNRYPFPVNVSSYFLTWTNSNI